MIDSEQWRRFSKGVCVGGGGGGGGEALIGNFQTSGFWAEFLRPRVNPPLLSARLLYL